MKFYGTRFGAKTITNLLHTDRFKNEASELKHIDNSSLTAHANKKTETEAQKSWRQTLDDGIGVYKKSQKLHI